MVIGTVATVDAFLPLMKRSDGYRRLVLTASIAAIAPGRFQGPYRAAKAAVTSIGETLDLELGPEGIGATVAFPSGMIQDEHIETAWEFLKQVPSVAADVRPPAGSAELGQAVAAEMSRDRADMATGYETAERILVAVDEGRRFVVTHGITVEEPARERLALFEAALQENAAYRAAATAH
jgi:NAD(P)-dependent dehydrogenase (short-subunit alcohol dehydrogenase family)